MFTVYSKLLSYFSLFFYHSVITKPRYSIAIGGVFIMVAQVLQVYSDGGDGQQSFFA